MTTPTLDLPDGRTVELPPCPACGATAMRCRRPSGHDASGWHDARETALAELCRCAETCTPWLEAAELIGAQDG